MPVMQARKRGTVEAYPLNMDDALNLMIQPFDVSRAVNEGAAYMASVNYALPGLGADNMFITTSAAAIWGVKVRVVTGGWATAQFCEDMMVPIVPNPVAIRALNRPLFALVPPGLLTVESGSGGFVFTTQLCEVFTGACEGIVLGGSGVGEPMMWILNPGSIYGIEVTDLAGIGNFANITVTFYLLEFV